MKYLLLLLMLALTRPLSAADAPPATQPGDPPFNRYVARALQDNSLILTVNKSTQSIRPGEQVDVALTLANHTGMDLTLPDVVDYFAVEVVPEADTSKAFLWARPLPNPDQEKPFLLKKGDRYSLFTALWFANEPLPGLPAERPALPAGKYRWRLIIRGTPLLASGWNTLTIGIPGLSDSLANIRTRRPKSRLIVVSEDALAPFPDENVIACDLAKALKIVQAGDTLYFQGAQTWNLTGPLEFPDDVWIVGEGATRTVLSLTSDSPDVPLLHMRGTQRLEGLTLTGPAANQHGSLLEIRGNGVSPTLFQCAFVPPEHAFATVACLSGASPLLQNCAIISPLGEYAVFARSQARPRIEYCTIVSRGFGVGMMEHSLPTIKHSIIVGRCPAIISDDGEFSISQSVVWCTAAGDPDYGDPVIRWKISPDAKMLIDPMSQVLKQPGMSASDPGFVGKGPFLNALQIRPQAPGAAYGAFAGENGDWGRQEKTPASEIRLDLAPTLHTDRQESGRSSSNEPRGECQQQGSNIGQTYF